MHASRGQIGIKTQASWPQMIRLSDSPTDVASTNVGPTNHGKWLIEIDDF